MKLYQLKLAKFKKILCNSTEHDPIGETINPMVTNVLVLVLVVMSIEKKKYIDIKGWYY